MIDILVYSETQQGIQDMVEKYANGEDIGVQYDWMAPGTMVLKADEEETEYDEDNWYCNLRFSDDAIAQAILLDAEAAYDAGQIKTYPSSRQPGVTHEFPWLNDGFDERVYFTRTQDGSYIPSWPRRIWAGGLRPWTTEN